MGCIWEVQNILRFCYLWLHILPFVLLPHVFDWHNCLLGSAQKLYHSTWLSPSSKGVLSMRSSSKVHSATFNILPANRWIHNLTDVTDQKMCLLPRRTRVVIHLLVQWTGCAKRIDRRMEYVTLLLPQNCVVRVVLNVLGLCLLPPQLLALQLACLSQNTFA